MAAANHDDGKRVSLTVPAALMPFVDLFRKRFEAAHSAPLGQHEAILTLIRRGLQASPEMPDAGEHDG